MPGFEAQLIKKRIYEIQILDFISTRNPRNLIEKDKEK